MLLRFGDPLDERQNSAENGFADLFGIARRIASEKGTSRILNRHYNFSIN